MQTAMPWQAGCPITSIELFEQNERPLRLYLRPGYSVIERRSLIPHSSDPYDDEILLLTRIIEL